MASLTPVVATKKIAVEYRHNPTKHKSNVGNEGKIY